MYTSAATPLIWISLLALLQGCAADKDKLLPHGEHDMLTTWNAAASGERSLHHAREVLRRSLEIEPLRIEAPYSRTATNEIRSQFPRLPNPDLTLYIYPHLAGSEQAPVPGYSTVFPFYQRVQYALPGERLENY